VQSSSKCVGAECAIVLSTAELAGKEALGLARRGGALTIDVAESAGATAW
jgi:hypothetical protein